MLRWPRSLALRAVSALLAVHLMMFLIVLGMTVLHGRSTRMSASDLALEFAVGELEFTGDEWVLQRGGAFESLSARNPSMWLLAGDNVRFVVVGEPPSAARRLFDVAGGGSSTDLASGGLAGLLPDAVVERHIVDGRAILLAAGGVEPETVTSMDVLRSFSPAPAVALILSLGFLGAMALLLAVPLLYRAIRPIVDDAASIGPDDVGRRLDESRAPPELLPLARAFNGALDRLEMELGRRKRLISNVAHELRTPLAVLSLRIDAVTGSPEEREGLRTAIGRVARLADQMLDLERLSLGAEPRGPVDLSHLAREVVADLAPMAVDAGYDLALDAPSAPVVVRGEPLAIRRAVTNLVSNAIAHGGGRGLVSVVVGEGQLEVRDEGPGVPKDLEPHLFEAFARGAAETGGSGLGLHLAREVMRGLGGQVDYRREGGATVFRLQFPEPGKAGA